jgi:hypothetical protein
MQRVPESGSPGPRAPRPWIIAVLVVLAVSGPAGADVVVRQRSVSESFPAFAPDSLARTLIVAGDRSRTEDRLDGKRAAPANADAARPRTAVTITRLEQDLVWALDPDAMEYTETSFTELRARLQEAGATEHGGGRDDERAYRTYARRTGEKKNVDGFACERWRIESVGTRPSEPAAGDTAIVVTLDAWVSRRIPGRDELTGFERRVAQKIGRPRAIWGVPPAVRASHGGGLGEIEKHVGAIPGWPVRMALEIAARPASDSAARPETRFRMNTETLGIEVARAPAGAFELPAGYRKGSRRPS